MDKSSLVINELDKMRVKSWEDESTSFTDFGCESRVVGVFWTKKRLLVATNCSSAGEETRLRWDFFAGNLDHIVLVGSVNARRFELIIGEKTFSLETDNVERLMELIGLAQIVITRGGN